MKKKLKNTTVRDLIKALEALPKDLIVEIPISCDRHYSSIIEIQELEGKVLISGEDY